MKIKAKQNEIRREKNQDFFIIQTEEGSNLPDTGVAMVAIWRRRGKEADPTNASTNGRGDAQRWMELLLCRGAHARLLVFGCTALCL